MHLRSGMVISSGMHLTRRPWVQLNYFHFGVGRFRSSQHNCGMAATATLECDAENQTADHIATDFLLCSPSHGPRNRWTDPIG